MMKYLVLIYSLWIGFSCLAQNNLEKYEKLLPFEEEYIQLQPEKKLYKLSKIKFRFPSSTNLDTNSVYLNESIGYKSTDGEKFIYYNFIRFFPNGMAFFSNTYLDKPNENKFDDLTDENGLKCFYSFTENGDVKLEVLGYYKNTFRFLFAKVDEDGLFFYKEKMRTFGGAKNKMNLKYQKIEVELASNTLEWK